MTAVAVPREGPQLEAQRTDGQFAFFVSNFETGGGRPFACAQTPVGGRGKLEDRSGSELPVAVMGLRKGPETRQQVVDAVCRAGSGDGL